MPMSSPQSIQRERGASRKRMAILPWWWLAGCVSVWSNVARPIQNPQLPRGGGGEPVWSSGEGGSCSGSGGGGGGGGSTKISGSGGSGLSSAGCVLSGSVGSVSPLNRTQATSPRSKEPCRVAIAPRLMPSTSTSRTVPSLKKTASVAALVVKPGGPPADWKPIQRISARSTACPSSVQRSPTQL